MISKNNGAQRIHLGLGWSTNIGWKKKIQSDLDLKRSIRIEQQE